MNIGTRTKFKGPGAFQHYFMKYIYIVIILTLITACAKPKPEMPTVFYPPAPNPARVQFLTFYTGEKDIYRRKSFFEAFITGASESGKRLDKAYGVAMREGKIYASDTNLSVMVFDLEKKEYYQLQGAQGMGKLIQPINIRIDADGGKFVSDPGRGQVVVFDKNDFYVAAFGSADLWRPVDAVPYEDQLYVADMKNYCITVLDKRSGTVLKKIGQTGEPRERLSRPTNLAFDPEGHLLVSDAGRFQIIKYDRDGHYLGTIGNQGSESGTFARPRGIAVDRAGRIFAVDAAFDNVQIFNKDSYFLMAFGGHGFLPGDLNLPAQVTIDYDNTRYFQQYVDRNFEIEHLVIVSSQFGERAISIYAVGKERGKSYPTDAEMLKKLKEKLKKSEKDQPAEKKPEPR